MDSHFRGFDEVPERMCEGGRGQLREEPWGPDRERHRQRLAWGHQEHGPGRQHLEEEAGLIHNGETFTGFCHRDVLGELG